MFRKLLVSIMAATIAVPVSLVGFSAPAQANNLNPNDPAVISLEQVPTKTPVVSDPGTASASPDCNRAFPSNPVIECGYATFGNTIALGNMSGDYRRPGISGSLPASSFEGFGLTSSWYSQLERAAVARKTARDPATPNALAATPQSLKTNIRNINALGESKDYYSSGAYWRDVRSWTEIRNSWGAWRGVSVGEQCEMRERLIKKGTPAVRDSKGKITKPAVPDEFEEYEVCWIVPETVVTETRNFGKEWGYKVETDTRTFRSLGSHSYYERTVNITANWYARSVNITGTTYYPTPTIKQVWCQTELGPGKLTGPYDHNGDSLKSQIGVNDSDLDPQTIERQWWTRPPASMASKTKQAPGGGFILMSNIGVAADSANASRTFSPGSETAESLVMRCAEDKPSYLASATNQPCKVLEPTHPLFGRDLPATHELCNTFVPGNYLKDLRQAKEMLCTYVERSWVAGGSGSDPNSPWFTWSVGRWANSAEQRVFIHCGKPEEAGSNPDRPNSPNATEYPITKAFWACKGDSPESGNKTWHPNQNYDFLTCGQTFVCLGNRTPTIVDVDSRTRTSNSSQLLASGTESQIIWDIPQGIRIVGNNGKSSGWWNWYWGIGIGIVQPDRSKAWQTWEVLGNSSPWNSTLDPNHRSQPVFASNLPNSNPNSSQSVLNYGVNDWNNPTLYIRGYRGTIAAERSLSVGSGLRVNAGELIPFGVYTSYNTTIPRNTEVFGRRVTIEMPVSCNMNPAYLYYVSGRATG
jgi:hypothetical protein